MYVDDGWRVDQDMTLRERAEAVLLADTAIARELLAMADRHALPTPAARAGVSPASVRAFVEGRPGWSSSARGIEGQSDRQIELGCTHMGFAVSGRAYPAIVRAVRDF